jgi:hypothetical protein
MRQTWSIEKAHQWYSEQPYLIGANFIPSSAINQLDMWQASTFDLDTIQRELGYASRIGMNVMRVFLHDLLWEQDQDGFCERIDTYLAIAASYQIKTILVIFDDCWKQTFSLGEQPQPIPYTHNSGWVQSPGFHVVNDPDSWLRLEGYVKGLLERFKRDGRVLMWDVYNEPGNTTSLNDTRPGVMQGERSLPLLKAAFDWVRSVDDLSQPVTAGMWNFTRPFDRLNQFCLENSDVLTFHSYEPPQALADRIKQLSKTRRPLICTEYMARGAGSTFDKCLPLLKKHHVGAINWGLVAGKTQTIYPWGWRKEKGEPDLFFHDIFYADGTWLYPNEERVIKQVTGAD